MNHRFGPQTLTVSTTQILGTTLRSGVPKRNFCTYQAAKTVANNLSEEEQAWVMDLLPLSPNDFKCCFTLFSKYFSSFVHTTCSLSVSVQYLAFAEVHLRVCTALSNCTTLGTEEYSDHVRSLDKNGTIALRGETFQNASSNDH